MAIFTKGNVDVEKIKIGDILYEFQYGIGIKSEVLTLPENDGSGYWTWKCKGVISGKEITYGVREGLSHYAPNLYDYEAYVGCQMI